METGLIINSYNFIVIQYFTESRKNDTVFGIFTNNFKRGLSMEM